ncbi:hypothetical protein HY745_10550 [Candidatus Desantisbacteria bacterium]|nr:hypothetical protein [Candidatus Desantisbacteria bacterium]
MNNYGVVGLVLPSAIHANEGATGIRKLFLNQMSLKYCYSYENKKKLFEIDSRFKFALIVAEKKFGGTKEFSCAFYLHDEEWLFDERRIDLKYSLFFVEKTGGVHLSFLECRDAKSLSIFNKCLDVGRFTLKSYLDNKKIILRQGFSLNRENSLIHYTQEKKWETFNVSLKNSIVYVYEGKNFYLYTDRFSERPQYSTDINNFYKKAHWPESIVHYRLAFRKVAASTNERTMVSAILPYGIVFVDSVCAETIPNARATYYALCICSIFNSFTFDYLVRQKVSANVMFYLIENLPYPEIDGIKKIFLSHTALQLISNHDGFAFIWYEQLGDNWREPNKKPFTWSVLSTDEERWEVRSAIDAVVADAYGLNREQYEHVLHSFDRASGSNPYTDICLAKFDELKQIGLDVFTKKYDPYWDIPLNENLPQPVIHLPIPQEEEEKDLFGEIVASKKLRKRK